MSALRKDESAEMDKYTMPKMDTKYPFLNFLGERCKAEHDLQDAQRTRAKCKSWPEKKSRERKLKRKSLENVNSHIANIKEEINKLEAKYPKEWNENVTKLTKHFYQKK